MLSSERIKVADLNSLLTCVICKGYYIDATTIVECLHSFCRTCIVRYLQKEKYCPQCEVQVHKTKPLVNIRSDQTLQDIVYKLVPNLFKNEMKRRRDFYSQSHIDVRNIPSSSEKRGDLWGCDRLIFTADDIISVSLEYYPLWEKLTTNSVPVKSYRRYFRCPGALKVYHLKKLLCAKYNLETIKIDVMYKNDILKNEYTLVDLAYIYPWKRSEPMPLFFKISQDSKCNSENWEFPPLANDRQIIISSATDIPSPCPPIKLESPTPSMAAAPSSRHPSGPPSPKMAEEPKEISLEKPNCAAMQTPNSPLFQPKVERNLKSVLKKPVHNSSIPDLSNVKTVKEEYSNKDVLHSDLRTSKGDLLHINGFRKKKKVTFSPDLVLDSAVDEDLVQNSYRTTPFRHKLSKCRSLIRLKSPNGTVMRNVIQMRNRVLSNKSS